MSEIRPKQKHEDPKYLEWVRKLPCCETPYCQTQWSGREVHHVEHATNDRLVIPVCVSFHRLIHRKGRKDGRKIKWIGRQKTYVDAFGFSFIEKAREIRKGYEKGRK